MNSDPGNELLQFAARFLETKGAVLEIKKDGVEAILPDDLSEFLHAPGYLCIKSNQGDETDDAYLIHYGSPLVDRIVEAACAETPLLACELAFDYIKSDGFDRLIKEQFHFYDVSGHIQSFANIKTDYLVLACRYTAQSDEQKEGMIHLAFNIETGSLIPGMTYKLSSVNKIYKTASKGIMDETRRNQILNQVRAGSKEIIMEEITAFRESMARRFKRDAANLEEYYQALEKEMRSALERQGLSNELIKDRQQKIDLLPQELERKKDDLLKKYSIKIRIVPCAALFVRTPAVKVLFDITGAGKHKTVSFMYNPVTKSIDPLVCQCCGTSMVNVNFCHNLHLLCSECRKRCPICG